MSTTNIQKTAIQGTIFLMITESMMLYATDGKIFLSQPVGVAYFIIWILWWVIALSLRSQKLFSNNRKTSAFHAFLYIGIILATCFGAPWEYIHFTQPIPRDGLLAWLGVSVTIFSIFLLTISMWMAGNLYGIRKNHYPCEYLITRGPYRYARHPGYLSVVLCVMGSALSLSSLIAWVAFAVTIGFSLLRIHKDEEKLEEIYGEAFRDYKVRNRWILLPGIF